MNLSNSILLKKVIARNREKRRAEKELRDFISWSGCGGPHSCPGENDQHDRKFVHYVLPLFIQDNVSVIFKLYMKTGRPVKYGTRCFGVTLES